VNGGCCSLTMVLFECGSKLLRIEEMAFRGCTLLTAISIPASVRNLAKKWAFMSGLIFESGESLHWMIVKGLVELSKCCEFFVARGRQELVFPGYSTEIIPETPNIMRLVKAPPRSAVKSKRPPR
jgi:hypothetical protein